MRYLLDTDHASIIQRSVGLDYQSILRHMTAHSPTDVVISVVSFREQVIGAHTRIVRAKSANEIVHGYEILSRIIRLYSNTVVVPYDGPASNIFSSLRSIRPPIKTMDLRIAAIALANGSTLVTRNLQDFSSIPGLQTEDWTK